MGAWLQQWVDADVCWLGQFSLQTQMWRILCIAALCVVARRGQIWADTWKKSKFSIESIDAISSGYLFKLLFIAVLCHFYRLSNFLLSIDDEYAAVRTDPTVWVTQGRWTIYWVERLLLPQPTLPFFPDFIFCLAMAVAYWVLLACHRVKANNTALLLFPIFCSFPSLTVIGEFYANVPSLGLGFVLCSIAVAVSQSNTPSKSTAQRLALRTGHGLLVGAAIGCYQPFVLVYAVFALGTIVCVEGMGERRSVRHFFRAQCAVALELVWACVVYVCIQRIHLNFLSSSEGYIADIMRLDLLSENPLHVLKTILIDLVHIYCGERRIYGVELPSMLWVMLWGFVGMGAALMQQRSWARIGMVTALVGVVLCLPFTFLLASGGHLPFRTFIAVPYVLWLLALFAQRQSSSLTRAIGTFCVMACVFQITYVNNLYAAQMAITQQRDRSFAAEIYQQIQSSRREFSLASEVKVDVYGMMPQWPSFYPTDISSTTAASFFSWDNGNPLRMVYFMNLLGYSNLKPLNPKERATIAPLYADMPIWPAPGSVVWRGDTVLIKLGAEPGVFHHSLSAGHVSD